MIVENQNNAAGVQFKMLTMRSLGERREWGGVWKSAVGCGKLHALYKLKPQAQRQPHHHGTVAWVLWTWTWMGIGHGWVVCAAPPAVVFVVTSLCKKQSERMRQRESKQQQQQWELFIWHFWVLRFAWPLNCEEHKRRPIAFEHHSGRWRCEAGWNGMGWWHCCCCREVVNFSCTILMGIMSGSKTRSAKLKLCGKTLFRDWDWDCKPRARYLTVVF